MYNAKPAVAAALISDTQLTALVSAERIVDGIAEFTGEPIYPYITFDELGNTESLHADDVEAETEVAMRIHIWHKGKSTSAIAGHVNRIMQAAGFGRNYSQDQDEMLESGLRVRHKIMSFSGTFPAESL